MSTYVLGFQSFCVSFLHHFVLGKLATSSIRVINQTHQGGRHPNVGSGYSYNIAY